MIMEMHGHTGSGDASSLLRLAETASPAWQTHSLQGRKNKNSQPTVTTHDAKKSFVAL